MLTDSQFIHAFERRTTLTANHRPAVPAGDRTSDLAVATRAVERFRLCFWLGTGFASGHFFRLGNEQNISGHAIWLRTLRKSRLPNHIAPRSSKTLSRHSALGTQHYLRAGLPAKYTVSTRHIAFWAGLPRAVTDDRILLLESCPFDEAAGPSFPSSAPKQSGDHPGDGCLCCRRGGTLLRHLP